MVISYVIYIVCDKDKRSAYYRNANKNLLTKLPQNLGLHAYSDDYLHLYSA